MILLTFFVSQVCAAEEVKVNHGSLEEMTTFCGGDIRKAIMQLQFWFQSKPKRGILDVNCYVREKKISE
jgi:DNA polymerase III delta prime subunit